MCDAMVKGLEDHVAGVFEGTRFPEILPKPERDARQFQPARAAAGVGEQFISIGGSVHRETPWWGGWILDGLQPNRIPVPQGHRLFTYSAVSLPAAEAGAVTPDVRADF